MSKFKLGPIEEFKPAGASLSVERATGNPAYRSTWLSPASAPASEPLPLLTSWSSWPPSIWRKLCKSMGVAAGTLRTWPTLSLLGCMLRSLAESYGRPSRRWRGVTL